jgi:hypothetical protein
MTNTATITWKFKKGFEKLTYRMFKSNLNRIFDPNPNPKPIHPINSTNHRSTPLITYINDKHLLFIHSPLKTLFQTKFEIIQIVAVEVIEILELEEVLSTNPTKIIRNANILIGRNKNTSQKTTNSMDGHKNNSKLSNNCNNIPHPTNGIKNPIEHIKTKHSVRISIIKNLNKKIQNQNRIRKAILK